MRNETKDLVSFGPAPIQTAEDARMAYLREEINEDELKEILAHWGHAVEPTTLGGPQIINLDRMDSAFNRKLPDVELPKAVTVEDRIKAVETKAKAREAATKAAPKVEAKPTASSAVVVDPNEKQKEAAEKVLADAARKEGAAKSEKADSSAPRTQKRGSGTGGVLGKVTAKSEASK